MIPFAAIKASAMGAKWLIVGIAFAGLLSALGVQTVRLSHAQAETSEAKRAHAQDVAESEQVARLASETYRREETRRAAELQKVESDATLKLESARNDARLAAAVSVGLRARFAALAAGVRDATSDSSVAGSSAPASDTAVLLADVFGAVNDAASELAGYADAARIAGEACERAFDSLTVAP